MASTSTNILKLLPVAAMFGGAAFVLSRDQTAFRENLADHSREKAVMASLLEEDKAELDALKLRTDAKRAARAEAVADADAE